MWEWDHLAEKLGETILLTSLITFLQGGMGYSCPRFHEMHVLTFPLLILRGMTQSNQYNVSNPTSQLQSSTLFNSFAPFHQGDLEIKSPTYMTCMSFFKDFFSANIFQLTSVTQTSVLTPFISLFSTISKGTHGNQT